jgi:hypothetical protein
VHDYNLEVGIMISWTSGLLQKKVKKGIARNGMGEKTTKNITRLVRNINIYGTKIRMRH